jgi:hypothetical protein
MTAIVVLPCLDTSCECPMHIDGVAEPFKDIGQMEDGASVVRGKACTTRHQDEEFQGFGKPAFLLGGIYWCRHLDQVHTMDLCLAQHCTISNI